VVLVIGGADTCFEDLFLTVGRRLLERGYSVALVDLPGQRNTATQGLHILHRNDSPRVSRPYWISESHYLYRI
jgi:hypothetical protein